MFPLGRIAALVVLAQLRLATLIIGAALQRLGACYRACSQLQGSVAPVVPAEFRRAAGRVGAAWQLHSSRIWLPLAGRTTGVVNAEEWVAALVKGAAEEILWVFLERPLVRGIAGKR